MDQKFKEAIAINVVGFEYFQECIKNGATEEQAKREMLTFPAQQEMYKRVEKMLDESEDVDLQEKLQKLQKSVNS